MNGNHLGIGDVSNSWCNTALQTAPDSAAVDREVSFSSEPKLDAPPDILGLVHVFSFDNAKTAHENMVTRIEAITKGCDSATSALNTGVNKVDLYGYGDYIGINYTYQYGNAKPRACNRYIGGSASAVIYTIVCGSDKKAVEYAGANLLSVTMDNAVRLYTG